MTERVFIGNDAGSFKMRVSKPGFEARDASVEECVVHEEQQRPLMYVLQGYANVNPGSTVTISLNRSFAFPPVVILKHESHEILAVYASLALTTGVLRITAYSFAVGSLVKYVVLAPQ